MSSERILYCHCAYANVVPPQVKAEVLEGLARSGQAFDAVADLCEMSARRDPALQRLAAGEGTLKIAACFPRAVKWLFAAAEAPLPEEDGRVHVCNMRVDKSPEVLSELLGESQDESQQGPAKNDAQDEEVA